MATFERTVGNLIGDDFADWRLAWNFYRGTPAGGHTYRFFQTSVINQDATAWNSEQNKDGEIIEFICPYADSHKSDPTRGFKTILAADARMGNVFGIFASGNTVILDGLYIERTVNNTGARSMVGFGSNNNSFIVRNFLIKGNGRLFGSGTYDRALPMIQHYRPNITITNGKIWNCGYALGGPGGTVGGPDGTQVIEDVDITNCDRAAGWGSQTPITFRNVAITNPSGPSTCWGNVPNYANIMENCADSDGSLATANGTVTNPQMNITPANEYQSLLDTQSGFLAKIRGKKIGLGNYSPGSKRLGETGTAPTYAGSTDIAGKARPGAAGFYAIGSHEQQYDTEWVRFIIDSGAVYRGFVSQDEPGELIGATRGGSVFAIEQDVKDKGYDGAAGPVKGGRINTVVNCKLTCNFVQIEREILSFGLPGSDYRVATTEAPEAHIELYRDRDIEDTDYIDNVVLVAQMMGTNNAVICGVKNALVSGNLELALIDNDEAVIPITFTGHYAKDGLNKDPFILMFPDDTTTEAPTTTTLAP